MGGRDVISLYFRAKIDLSLFFILVDSLAGMEGKFAQSVREAKRDFLETTEQKGCLGNLVVGFWGLPVVYGPDG
jgi:hypothetical protein